MLRHDSGWDLTHSGSGRLTCARLLASVAAIAACLLSASGRAYAGPIDANWQVPLANWSDPNAWEGGEPIPGKNANINNGGTAVITDNGEACFYLTLGSFPGWSGFLQMAGGMLGCAEATVGHSGVGMVAQGNGSIAVANGLYLGRYLGAQGAYELSGPGILNVGSLYVGYYGLGSFTHSGTGNVTVIGATVLGRYAGSQGTYEMAGTGSIDSNSLTVGYYGTGSFSHSGSGTNMAKDALILGKYSTSQGTYELSGTGTLSAAWQTIGAQGWGNLIQTAGLSKAWRGLILGESAGGRGTYQLGGGGRLDANWECVGYFGTGTFVQSGGTNSIRNTTPPFQAADLHLGYQAGAQGTYELQAGTLTAGDEYAGYFGTGSFVHTDGDNTMSHALYLGYQPGSQGNYQLSGRGILKALVEYIGYSGMGTFVQTDGNNVDPFDGGIYLGYNAGATGTYQLGGSGKITAVGEYVGYSGTGTFIQNDGNNTVGFSATLLPGLYLGYNFGADGTYQLGGKGRLNASAEYVGYSGTGTFVHADGNNAIGTATGGPPLYTGSLYLGCTAGGQGTYLFDGNGRLDANREYVGYQGTGSFVQSAGVNSLSGSLFVGFGQGSQGTYDLFGKAGLYCRRGGPYDPNAFGVCVGYDGNGLFRQSGGDNQPYMLTVGFSALGAGRYEHTGGNNLPQAIFLGYNPGSEGTYALGGAGVLAMMGPDSPEYIGYFGTGTFIQTGGSHLGGTAKVYLGYKPGSQGAYQLSGTGLLAAQSLFVGFSGTGVFTQTDGNCAVAKELVLGNDLGSQGTYELSGPGRLTSWNLYVGNSGTGLFVQTNGNCAVADTLYVGRDPGSSGTYQLSGNGRLTADSEYVGWNGTGLIAQSDGNNTISGLLHLGGSAYGASGTYQLSGNGHLTAMNQDIGGPGTGLFLQTGGRNTVGHRLSVGGSNSKYLLSGTGVLTVNPGGYFELVGRFEWFGGTLTTPNLMIHYNGTLAMGFNFDVGALADGSLSHGNPPDLNSGTLEITNGATATETSGTSLDVDTIQAGSSSGNGAFTQTGGSSSVTELLLGRHSGFSGTYQLCGNGRLAAQDEYVGYSGTGLFTHSDGNNTVSGMLYLGYDPKSTGTYQLSGSGSLTAYDEYVGSSGTGVFTHSAGTNTVSGTLYLGSNSGSSGTYQLSGSGSLAAGSEVVCSNGTGLFTQSDGNNTVTGHLYLGQNPWSFGSYQLSDNGRLTAGCEYVGYYGYGLFTQTGGINTVGETLYVGYGSPLASRYRLGGAGVLTVDSGGSLRVGADSGVGRLEWFGGALTTPSLTVGSQGTLAMGFSFDVGSLVDGSLSHGSAPDLSLATLEITNGAAATESNGTSLSVKTLQVGSSNGDGVFAQNGGTNTINGQLYVGAGDGYGTYALSGGNLTVPRVTVGANGTMVFSGGTLAGSSADANLLAGVTNSGLIEFTSGTWWLASIDCPDPDAPAGTVVIDAGATLWVGELDQSAVYVSGTLILYSALLNSLAPPGPLAIEGDLPPDGNGLLDGDAGTGPSAPEPASVTLLCLGLAAMLRRRARPRERHG